MKFQLVIQFRPTGAFDFETLVAMEDAFTAELGDSAIVDGHDIGSEDSRPIPLAEMIDRWTTQRSR